MLAAGLSLAPAHALTLHGSGAIELTGPPGPHVITAALQFEMVTPQPPPSSWAVVVFGQILGESLSVSFGDCQCHHPAPRLSASFVVNLPIAITYSTSYAVTANEPFSPVIIPRMVLTLPSDVLATPIPGGFWLFGSVIVAVGILARRRNYLNHRSRGKPA